MAGRLASRRFRTLPGQRTRPTTDRVREAVFAVMAADRGLADQPADTQLTGCRFLDLYAGSGAVGLEAASRGAQVRWVERDTVAAGLIVANCLTLGLVPDVVTAPVETWLAKPAGGAGGFDIIWLDPPYDRPTPDINAVIALIARYDWLAAGGLILVERSVRSPALEFPENFLNNRTKRYGETVVYLAEKVAV